jgi:hypothetical protein
MGETVTSLTMIAGAEAEEALGLPPRDESSLKDAQQLAQFAVRLVNAPPSDSSLTVALRFLT